jgi:hypothetical protein
MDLPPFFAVANPYGRMRRVWLFEAHRIENGHRDQTVRVSPSGRFRRWYDEHPGFLMENNDDRSEWFDRTTFVVDRPGRGAAAAAAADRYHGGYMLPHEDEWEQIREVHMRWRYAGATIYSMLCPEPIPVLTLEHIDYLPMVILNEMRTVPATRVIHRAWRRRWDPEFVAREIEELEARLARHRVRTPSPPRPIAGDGVAIPAPVPAPSPVPAPKFVADALIAASVAAEATCPITMEPITAATAAVTSCFHVFEANAIAIWLTDHQTCPTCKQAAILPA